MLNVYYLAENSYVRLYSGPKSVWRQYSRRVCYHLLIIITHDWRFSSTTQVPVPTNYSNSFINFIHKY